jgi:hypothetical protein
MNIHRNGKRITVMVSLRSNRSTRKITYSFCPTKIELGYEK